MARNTVCNVCKRPYPQHLASCPHCKSAGTPGKPAPASQPAEDFRPLELGDLPGARKPLDSDADIDLGGQSAGDAIDLGATSSTGSGASKVSWASLVKEKEESSEIDFGIEPPVKFDAISDADIVQRAASESAASLGKIARMSTPGAPVTPVVGPANLPPPTAPGAKSLLSAQSPSAPPAPGQSPGGPGTPTQVAPATGAPTMMAPKSPQPTMMAPSSPQPTMLAPQHGAVMPLGKPTMLAPRAPQPTMLGPSPGPTQLAPPQQPTTLAPPGEAEREAQSIAEDPAVASKGPHGAPAGLDDVLQDWFADQSRGTGKDPIAESVESQVDLSGRAASAPTSSGELTRSLLEGAVDSARAGETSAVDLGSVPNLQLASPGELEQADALRPADGSGKLEESSAVDLGSHPSLDLPFTGDSDSKAQERPKMPADGGEPKIGSDPSVELSPSAKGLPGADQRPDSDVDWDQVPTTGGTEEDRLSKIGMAAAAAARKKQVKPRYGRRWVGGGMIGLLVGAAACVALWVMGIEPFTRDRKKQLGEQLTGLGLSVPRDTSGGPGSGAGSSLGNFLNNGEHAQAMQWIDANFEEDNKEHLAARGQARWILYLQEHKGAAPQRTDDKVKQAIDDLTRADTPEALFWLGHIQEATKQAKEARATYAKGKSKADGAQQRKFDAAIDRLDLTEPGAEPGAQLAVPHGDLQVRAKALLVLLTQLQAGDSGDTADDEAGYYFWKAAKLARANKFDEARTALEKARDLHNKMRFARLRKAQNPNSDPTEEIFLKACDEIQAYWKMRDELENKSEYKLAKYKDPVKALEALISDQKTAAAAAKGGDVLPVLAKALGLKDEKPELKEVTDKIGELMTAKKLADEVTTGLTDAKYVTEDQKDVQKGLQAALKDAAGKKTADETLAKVGKRLEKSGVKAEDVEKGIEQLASARDQLNDTLQEAAKQLADARYLDDPKADPKRFLEAVALTIEATRSPLVSALARMGSSFTGLKDLGAGAVGSMDLTGRLAASQAQAARLQLLLRESRSAQDMLDIYIPLLESAAAKDILDKAALDAQRVLKDAASTPELKAEARCVEGLVLSKQGKYDEARTALADSLKAKGAAKQGEWRMAAQRALKDLEDPSAYVLPRAEELAAAGQLEAALAVLNSGAQMFPKSGLLLAQRSQLQLDLALSKAKARLAANDPGVAEATKDAQAAVAAGSSAEGNYALGRIAEETRDLARAEQSYRAAVNAHPANDSAGSRYRVALARVLLQRRPAPLQPGGEQRIGRLPAPAAGGPRQPANRADLLALVVLLTTGLQPALEDQPMPDVDEAIKLAEAAIKAGNNEGYLILAQALARKGQWNKALEQYITGLDLLSRGGHARLKPEYAAGLRFLIQNHPAFRRPDSLSPPDPLLGEKRFAQGLRLFNAHLFSEAEREFFEAVRYNDQDARYWYYLGLARLPQGKRTEAADAFQAGALLERQNKPSPGNVSLSLERVQGPIRQTLNSYRP